MALKNFKEALQMLEHTSFSPNQAKLYALFTLVLSMFVCVCLFVDVNSVIFRNFSICLCLEQAGKHLDALKHCEISVAMCKELMKKMKTVDEEIGDLSTLAQKKLKVLTDVVEKLRLKTARLWVRARDVEGEREEEPATFLAKKRRLEDVMSLTRVFGP